MNVFNPLPLLLRQWVWKRLVFKPNGVFAFGV